jgi:hypothetical protein
MDTLTIHEEAIVEADDKLDQVDKKPIRWWYSHEKNDFVS